MDNGKVGTAIPKPIEKNKSLNLTLFQRLIILNLIGQMLSNSDSNKKINPTTKSSETLHPKARPSKIKCQLPDFFSK
jgi:hypothetical protein